MIQLRYMYHRFQSFKKSRPFHIFFVYKAYQGIHMENALHRGMNVIIICIEYGPLYLCQNLVLQPRGSVIILLLNSELLLLNHEIKIFRKALLPLHEKEFPTLCLQIADGFRSELSLTQTLFCFQIHTLLQSIQVQTSSVKERFITGEAS